MQEPTLAVRLWGIRWGSVVGFAVLALGAPGVGAQSIDPETLGRALYGRINPEAAAKVEPSAYRYPPGDIRRYGAVGDDSTDNSDALQRAFAICEQGVQILIPEGIFRHSRTLRLTDLYREGCVVKGQSSGDYGSSAGRAPRRGSILKYTGNQAAVLIDGAQRPKFVAFDGVTFVGHPGAADGLLIERATWIEFNHSGWFGYSSGNAVRLSTGNGTFTGGIRFFDSWWSSNYRGVYVDSSPVHVLSFIRASFHSNTYGFTQGAPGGSYFTRHLKFIDSHFEQTRNSDILIHGGVAGLMVTGSYFEQNELGANAPRIHLTQSGSSPLSGGVVITGNVFSKALGEPSSRFIEIGFADGVRVADNWSAYGDHDDRYSVVVGPMVSNYEIEPPSAAFGVQPYPILVGKTKYVRPVVDERALPVFRSEGTDVFTPDAVDAAANAEPQGYLDRVQNVQSSDYVLALSDRGKHVINGNNMGVTYFVPSTASVPFPVGSEVVIINDTNGRLAIAPLSGVTLVWSNDGTQGARALGARGQATLLKVGRDRWMVRGTGLGS